MYRIRIESCENINESYTFDAETLAGVIALCLTELSSDDYSQLDLTEAMAILLETIAEAMRRHEAGDPPIAKQWDFSSPEEAYYVMFFEDSDDDTRESCKDIWDDADKGLDKAVRDIVSPGWTSVDA